MVKISIVLRRRFLSPWVCVVGCLPIHIMDEPWPVTMLEHILFAVGISLHTARYLTAHGVTVANLRYLPQTPLFQSIPVLQRLAIEHLLEED